MTKIEELWYIFLKIVISIGKTKYKFLQKEMSIFTNAWKQAYVKLSFEKLEVDLYGQLSRENSPYAGIQRKLY